MIELNLLQVLIIGYAGGILLSLFLLLVFPEQIRGKINMKYTRKYNELLFGIVSFAVVSAIVLGYDLPMSAFGFYSSASLMMIFT